MRIDSLRSARSALVLLIAMSSAALPGAAGAASSAVADAESGGEYGVLVARDAWIRETPPGRTVSAGYLTLVNPGPEPLILVDASSSGAERVEFHTHSHVDGMMRMRRVAEVEVPAGGSVSFVPGGLHLMLFGTASPREGAVVDVLLETASGESLEVAIPVLRSAPSDPAATGATGHAEPKGGAR